MARRARGLTWASCTDWTDLSWRRDKDRANHKVHRGTRIKAKSGWDGQLHCNGNGLSVQFRVWSFGVSSQKRNGRAIVAVYLRMHGYVCGGGYWVELVAG